MQILTWYIDKQLFGMDLKFCREVNRDMQIVSVPGSKDYIAGIVNLRGDVVTVLHLQVQLGYKTSELNEGGIIIRLKDRRQNTHIALKADSISDVMDVLEENIKETPAHFSEIEARYIHNVVMTEKGLIVILNPEEITKVH